MIAAEIIRFEPSLRQPVEWTVLVTDEGEPQAAFARGHRDIATLRHTAEDAIIAAFAAYSAQLAGDVIEILEAAGGAVISHGWMRMSGADATASFFEFCQPTADGAFPVTAVRFQ